MASNSTSEYKVVADKIVSPDEDIIIQITGDLYKGSITPPNKYVTAGEIDEGSGGSTTKSVTLDGNLYEIYQASGGVNVVTDEPTWFYETATTTSSQTNSSSIEITVSPQLDTLFTNIQNLPETFFFRRIELYYNNSTKLYTIGYQNGQNNWVLYPVNHLVTVDPNTSVDVAVLYGGAPIKWWDADTLGFMPEGDEWKFRGAKIDYHAYSTDSGSLVGTIYIASDSGDMNVTHIETGSGANDLGTIHLWHRMNSERHLYLYRKDTEASTTRIQWTAQVYYGPEIWD